MTSLSGHGEGVSNVSDMLGSLFRREYDRNVKMRLADRVAYFSSASSLSLTSTYVQKQLGKFKYVMSRTRQRLSSRAPLLLMHSPDVYVRDSRSRSALITGMGILLVHNRVCASRCPHINLAQVTIADQPVHVVSDRA
jgi:hypothetical protein